MSIIDCSTGNCVQLGCIGCLASSCFSISAPARTQGCDPRHNSRAFIFPLARLGTNSWAFHRCVTKVTTIGDGGHTNLYIQELECTKGNKSMLPALRSSAETGFVMTRPKTTVGLAALTVFQCQRLHSSGLMDCSRQCLKELDKCDKLWKAQGCLAAYERLVCALDCNDEEVRTTSERLLRRASPRPINSSRESGEVRGIASSPQENPCHYIRVQKLTSPHSQSAPGEVSCLATQFVLARP